MQAKKLTIAELRSLITEALNEDHHEKNELAEDAENAAEEEKMQTRAAQLKNDETELSESAQLDRWRKLAGLLKD